MNHRPCVWCGSVEHTQFYCRMKKRKPLVARKPIKKQGKVAKQWAITRDVWFAKNPRSFYNCYICGLRMHKSETTLDHVVARTRASNLRFKLSNLKPCCWKHNELKGSRSIEQFLELYPEFKDTVRL